MTQKETRVPETSMIPITLGRPTEDTHNQQTDRHQLAFMYPRQQTQADRHRQTDTDTQTQTDNRQGLTFENLAQHLVKFSDKGLPVTIGPPSNPPPSHPPPSHPPSHTNLFPCSLSPMLLLTRIGPRQLARRVAPFASCCLLKK